MIDFLSGRALNEPRGTTELTEGPVVTEPFTDMLKLLRDVRSELRKLNPTQLVQITVEPSSTILDTGVHLIRFVVASQAVPVYHILAYNSYDQDVYVSPVPIIPLAAGINTGVKIAKSGALWEVQGIEWWELYISTPALSNNKLVVNGPSDTTHGMFNIWAWTSDEWAIAYQPDRR